MPLAGLDDAAWHLPGAAPSDAGGPDWSLAEHVGHIADWQELAIDYVPRRGDDRPLAVRRRLRRRGLRPLQRAPPRAVDDDAGRVDRWPASRPPGRVSCGRPGAPGRAGPRARGVGLDPHGPRWPLPGPPRDPRAVGRPAASPPGRRRPVRRGPAGRRPRRLPRPGRAVSAQFDALVRAIPLEAWTAEAVTPGWDLRDHVGHLADWASEAVAAIEVWRRRGHWLADPDEGVDPWNERHVADARAPAKRRPTTLARYDASRAGPPRGGRHPERRGPALAGRLVVGLRLPARPHPQAPGHARPVVRRPDRPRLVTDRADPGPPRRRADHRGHRRGRPPARVPHPPARPGRGLHRRARRCPPAVHPVAARDGAPGHPADRVRASRSATPSGRPTGDAWPTSATARSGSSRPTGRARPASSASPAAAASRAGPRTASASPSCRDDAAGARSG